MQLNKQQKTLVDKVIEGWTDAEIIDIELANKLKNFDSVQKIDWKKVAKLSFWLAIASIIVSISSFFANEWILKMINYLFEAPKFILSLFFAFLASITFVGSIFFKKRNPQKTFSTTFIHLLGAVFLTFSFGYLLDTFKYEKYYNSTIFLFGTFSYGFLGYYFKSIPLWILSLLSLVLSYGTFSYEWTNAGNYFFGMNFPMRLTFLAFILYITSILLEKNENLKIFIPSSQWIFLFLFFFFLWILSITGNVPDYPYWEKTKQITRILWAIFSLVFCAVAIYVGFKNHDHKLQILGFIFFLLNLYTRYFEYFWYFLDKAIFFLIMGLSFWLVGTRAEKFWRLEKKNEVEGQG